MADNSRHPLSPHLQVYRLPLTALVSIAHRLTGVILSLGALLLVGVLSTIAAGAEYYAVLHSHLASWYGKVFLIGFSFALYFHACSGVRHLFWDIGWGFALRTATRNSRMVLGAALLLTLFTWIIALGVFNG